MIVGNNSSGMDIARELVGKLARVLPPTSAHASDGEEVSKAWVAQGGTGAKVVQSVLDITAPPPMDYDPRDENSPAWSKKIEVVDRIERIEAGGKHNKGIIHFIDGSSRDDIDVIFFATGFAL